MNGRDYNVEHEFHRGEVYWIQSEFTVGSEMGKTRPIVVVSSELGNVSSDCITGVFLTTREKLDRKLCPTVTVTGRRSWVLCNQIRTIDKYRVTEYVGKLTDREMAAVEDGIRRALDLEGGIEDDSKIKSLEARVVELEEENERLREKSGGRSADSVVQVAMWKKLYEKVLDELVALKVETDLAKKMVAPEVKVEKVETPKNEVKAPEKTPEKAPEKVNINTCTKQDLMSVGVCNTTAVQIIKVRNEVGRFDKLEDLTIVPRCGDVFVKKYAPKLEV